MHVGVMSGDTASRGGVHQYELSMLDGLAGLRGSADLELTLLLNHHPEPRSEGSGGWAAARVPLLARGGVGEIVRGLIQDGWLRDRLARAAHRLALSDREDLDRVSTNPRLSRFLSRRGVDWLLYTAPSVQAFRSGLPYVMPVHDLQHRLQPSFPEVSAYGAWEHREYLYRNGTRHATLILADSEVGRDDIVHFYGQYGVSEDRIRVLPFVPPPYLIGNPSEEVRADVRRRFRLPERYLYYPSHLWPHKNHVRLVQAIGLLQRECRLKVDLVLSGNHRGTIRSGVFQEIRKEADRLRVSDLIHFLGYVPHEAMSAVYAEATGLAMPTFFGPTNIPIVEAWLLRCPVLTSDIRGIREQVGDAGILVDPRSVEAIAEGVCRLWESEALRERLIQRGQEKLAAYTREDFVARLAQILEEAGEHVRHHRKSGSEMAS